MLINNKQTQTGFTLVEMAVVAPIVILVIGTFIYAIITMTGDVMATRAANVLAYNIKDTLSRIEADFKNSNGYLAESLVPTSPQGSDGSTAKFTTATSGTSNNSPLIIKSYATDKNPLSADRNIIYMNNSPNACISGSTSIPQNTPLTLNTIYFVSSNSLWRRVITPTGTTGCTGLNPAALISPWQQPSCSPGYNPTTSPICKTNDEKLVENLDSTNGLQITYDNANRITIKITATSTAAGRNITRSDTISAVNIN
jgi:Tfp pilus assembly protein PilE